MAAKLKVYVAGKFGDKPAVRALQQAILASLPSTITHDWTVHEDGEVRSETILRQYAEVDINAVLAADVVVALFNDPAYAYRGTFAEIGAALGARVPVCILCPDRNGTVALQSCFAFHGGITHFAEQAALLDHLKAMHLATCS